MIRADLDPRSRPARRPRRGRSRAAAAERGDEPDLGESPGNASLSAAGGGPGLGAGERKGRGGGSPVRRRRRPRAPRRASAPRPARRRGAALAPGASERRRLRQDPAPQHRRRRAARPALRRRRRRPGREAPSALAGSRRPAAQPRSKPACRRGGAARPGRGPERPRIQPESLRGGGRSGLGGRQDRRPGVFRLPGRPAADAEILALWAFDLVLAIRLRWARPLPLIAGKILDPSSKVGRERRRPRPGDPAWARPPPGDRAWPPPPPSTSPPTSPAAPTFCIAVAPKLRAKPAAKIVDLLLGQDCVCAGRGGPPRADDRPRRPPAVRPPGRARRRARALRAGPRSGCTAYERRGAPPPARGRRAPRRRTSRSAAGRPLARMDAARRSRHLRLAKNPSRARRWSAWSARTAGSTI